MEKYGNILIARRMVISLLLCVCALVVLMTCQIVKADSTSGTSTWWFKVLQTSSSGETNWVEDENTLTYSGSPFVYSFMIEDKNSSASGHSYTVGWVSPVSLSSFSQKYRPSTLSQSERNGVYFYTSKWGFFNEKFKLSGSKTDIFVLYDDENTAYQKITHYVKTGEKSDGMIIGGSDTKPTAVTNESMGYLQDVKLNLSYITPIKGDSIFETTNYQIYSDMIYNLKWNSKKTSTNYDLSSSYVQLYAKAEYSKSEYDNVSATDFIDLGDYEKASKGKLKFSFMELFEKSNNCKSAYLSAFPLSSADYKNGKLQACSVTSNIKYKFYIRVYKGTDKGPWLCVSEKGSHHSNEFVNSGVKVPFNVSSGDLDSDGTYKPDGNINENGNGITGTGTDKDDADADTNANDKIQSKHDSSNTTFDKLEEFVQGIGDVPKMIADIFSFLPSWCLDVVGIGFSLLMILIVVKFIRG